MVRKLLLVCCAMAFASCGELQGVVNNFPGEGNTLSNADIAAGLKQALNQGIDRQVRKLAQPDGFFRNELVRILLPAELQKVESTLRDLGMGDLADEGLKLLNRAAEDAVGEATPIFLDAVKGITFSDARNILLGNDRAATAYLQQSTQARLYQRFLPIIQNSFEEVGADKVWSTIIARYNAIPFTSQVNPDLADYVTGEALDGVYTMIAQEEIQIRNSLASRTTDLLKKVFALQD